MKYSEIVGIESFFDSTFNMTEERENYWKQFISNEKFESNLKEIINAFRSSTMDQHKSIWVQGTYGTGKSHSTSVVKHLLSDDIESINDYIDKLSNPQLREMIKAFRKDNRVFPVVFKGTYSIVDTEELKYTIQKEVTRQLEISGHSITLKSDFQAVVEMLNDEKFNSFWESMLSNELDRYASSTEELIELMNDGDVEVLKEINNALKRSGIIKATPDIKQWLIEVMTELRERGIADYLVLFWDEFTSLLEISERRSILNCIQDIAELSKAPRNDDSEKPIGVYVFLVTHKSMEATDSYKELQEDEKTMAKARFLDLKYDMQDITTYHILSNAIKIKNQEEYDKLVDERVILHSEVSESLKEIVEPMDKSAQIQTLIRHLYPFHPYTAYLATFVSRAIGSAERSIFEFLNDEDRGFKEFIENDISEVKYLTADRVWDFFAEAFSEDRTNNFDAIVNKYSMYSSKLSDDSCPELVVFKVILLLNLLNRVTQIDGANQEKSLVNPSKTNIMHVLSGAWSSEEVNQALESINDKQIVLKGPDDIYEVSSSSIPIEKIQNAKDKLYPKYEDVSTLIEEYPAYATDIKNCIKNAEGYNRATDFAFVSGALSQVSMESQIQRSLIKDNREYATKIAILLFRGETPTYDSISNRAESSIESQKQMILSLSQKENMKDVIFIISSVSLGQQRFEGIIDAKARELVAKETKMEDPSAYEKKATSWIEKWKTDIVEGGASIIFRGEQANTPTYKSAANAGVINDSARIFEFGSERLKQIANASTSWKQINAKKTVEKILFAKKREQIEKFPGAESGIPHLLKDKNGNWLFDEDLNYIGQYDPSCPITVLMKVIEDKIAELRNKSVVDIEHEFKFLSQPPYGYYNNYVCMASVALAFRRYIEKMYLADQGSLVTETIMRDIVNAAFAAWLDNKHDSKLRVRFSTAEEKELIDLIQTVFNVSGDGISETKWNLRDVFKREYKSPLWALKYVKNKGDEFNSVIDSLFSLANAHGESITQEDISALLEGLKKMQTSIALVLEDVKDSSCIMKFIEDTINEVNFQVDDYSNLMSYLNQNLADDICFWKEEDVKLNVLRWCALQNGSSSIVDYSDEDDETVDEDEEIVDEIDDLDEFDDSEEIEAPEFEPIDMTDIVIGRTHATIEAATELINSHNFEENYAKEFLVRLCKEYPVICSGVIKYLSED